MIWILTSTFSDLHFFFLFSNAKFQMHLRTCRLSRKDARTIFFCPWKREKEKSLARVRGLWNMQEWECTATCDSGKQQRVSRVQMPRNFVHPWVICGTMPNANTASLSICIHPRGAAALARVHVHSHPENTDRRQTRHRSRPLSLAFEWQ